MADQCVCGSVCWSLDEPPWCSICGLPAGAAEEHYANLAASILPPVDRCPIPALATLVGIGTPVVRLKTALRALGGATVAGLMAVTGDGWDATHALLSAGLAKGRIVAREQAVRRRQGELVGGVVLYSFVEERR